MAKVRKVKRSRYWMMDYKDHTTGKRVRVSSETTIKENALRKAGELENESWERGKLGAPVQSTVREIVAWCWDNHWSRAKNANKSEFEMLMKAPLQYFGETIACELKVAEIQSYITERLEDVAKSTVNREMSNFRSAFNKAIKTDGMLKSNPFSNVAIFDESDCQRNRVATDKEREMLIGHSAGVLQDIIEFDFNQGLRQGEIRKLKWTDLDLERERMRVVSYKRKGSTIRYVRILKGALPVLLRRPRISEYVFCNPAGEMIPRYGLIHSGFPRLVDSLGIKDFNFHDIRHTFATNYYRATRDLRATQMLLGHTNTKTTERYLNLSDDDVMLPENVSLYPKTWHESGILLNGENRKTSKSIDSQISAVSSVG